MGEYARRRIDGEEIKIGTCEDMYYLRYDQRGQVAPLPGNVDPVRDADALRFRFPFPDEDHIPPGEGFYEAGYGRGVIIPGLVPPVAVAPYHSRVQFTAHNGYLTSLPCPESGRPMPEGVTIHRNGYGGAVELVQVRIREGRQVPVFRCKGCGHQWREEDQGEIERVAMLLRSEGDRKHRDQWTVNPDGSKAFCGAEYWHKLADRLLEIAGIEAPAHA